MCINMHEAEHTDLERYLSSLDKSETVVPLPDSELLDDTDTQDEEFDEIPIEYIHGEQIGPTKGFKPPQVLTNHILSFRDKKGDFPPDLRLKRIATGIVLQDALKELEGSVKKSLFPQAKAFLLAQIELNPPLSDALFLLNPGLVPSRVRKYQGHGVDRDDLIVEGQIGMLRAIQKFDTTRGTTFSTYAVWWIDQAITRTMADQSRLIRLPVHVHDANIKFQQTIAAQIQALGRRPTNAELEPLLKEQGLTDGQIDFLLHTSSYVSSPVSLDRPIGDDDFTLGSIVPAHDDTEDKAIDTADQQATEKSVKAALDTLPPRHALILRLRQGIGYDRPRTLQEVGEALGISRERVRQIETEAQARFAEAYSSVKVSKKDLQKLKKAVATGFVRPLALRFYNTEG